MPAGHSLPPHCVSFVWRIKGGLRRLSNARVTCCDGIGSVEGTRSSEMDRIESSSAESDVILAGREDAQKLPTVYMRSEMKRNEFRQS